MATLQATAVTGNLSCTNFTGGTLAAAVVIPGDHIRQIRTMVSDTGYSVSGNNNWTDAPAWDVGITPAASGNHILYQLSTQMECRYPGHGGGVSQCRVTHNFPGSYVEFADMFFGTSQNTLTNITWAAACSRTSVLAPGNTNAGVFRPQYREGHGDGRGWFGNTSNHVAGAERFDGTWAIAMEFVPP